mmetsp:Transcript_75631/g.231474  ORF Transcript_75631/g.231474 Transcript_75631/m.231474 type:complete len:214 (+) Transcript_75631:2209-2850(+)
MQHWDDSTSYGLPRCGGAGSGLQTPLFPIAAKPEGPRISTAPPAGSEELSMNWKLIMFSSLCRFVFCVKSTAAFVTACTGPRGARPAARRSPIAAPRCPSSTRSSFTECCGEASGTRMSHLNAYTRWTSQVTLSQASTFASAWSGGGRWSRSVGLPLQRKPSGAVMRSVEVPAVPRGTRNETCDGDGAPVRLDGVMLATTKTGGGSRFLRYTP